MSAFYNERDPYAAEWLRNLIAAGHVAPGVVDERDIRDIRPDELLDYEQCHFFAGIGVWSHALRSAGWPDDRPIWTGSCPCQPFSAAGARGGEADERHLWPHWFWLIDQCRPATVLGEQVASKDGLGWLDLVSADMEGAGYAFGASDLCAAGFGGAHIRQRLYFVGMADADCGQRDRIAGGQGCERDGAQAGWQQGNRELAAGGSSGGLADADHDERREIGVDSGGRGEGSRAQGLDERPADCGALGQPRAPMLGRHAADWLFCRDGKWRPVGPGTFPLAHEAPARVGRLRAYGNALDAETAQEFAAAVLDLALDRTGSLISPTSNEETDEFAELL